MFPTLYLRVDDGILGIIEDRAIENGKLDELREMINQYRQHEFFKCVGEVEIGALGGDVLWDMSEDDIKREMMEQRVFYPGMTLDENDIIVEKRDLHYGRKEKNPVSKMRFTIGKLDQELFRKPIEDLPTAYKIDESEYESEIPRSFVKRTIRFFSRHLEKKEFITHVFYNWRIHREQRLEGPENCVFKSFDECPNEGNETQPVFLTQDSDTYSASAYENENGQCLTLRKRKDIDDSPNPAKKKLFE